MYLRTTSEQAPNIIAGQMLKGRSGLAGFGFYFAYKVEEAQRWAANEDVVLECQVWRGKVLHASPSSQLKVDLASLNAMSFDSVEITGLDTGSQLVVYAADQVKNCRQIA